jgi:hypothetical protein
LGPLQGLIWRYPMIALVGERAPALGFAWHFAMTKRIATIGCRLRMA